jgi:hypothetical protein
MGTRQVLLVCNTEIRKAKREAKTVGKTACERGGAVAPIKTKAEKNLHCTVNISINNGPK